MVWKVDNLPTLKEAGRILEKEGLVSFGKKAYNQIGGNCFEIASKLAELFGYSPIKSRGDLTDLILYKRAQQLWGGSLNLRFSHRSPVVLVVRTPDNPGDAHVALEAYGREYNFGPCSREGFEVEMRIPLYRKQE